MYMIYAVYFKVPLYESYSTIILTNDSNKSINQYDLSLNSDLIETYKEIIKSNLVINRVISNLNLDYNASDFKNKIKIESVNGTDLIKIRARDSNNVVARDIVREIDNILKEEVESFYNIKNIKIVDNPIVLNTPCNMNIFKELIIVVFISLSVSVMILFLIYYFDDTVKSKEKLENELNFPVIGEIPKVKINNELIFISEPKSLFSEEVRKLRTNLDFILGMSSSNVLMITSTNPSEGKSLISANLGVSYSMLKRRVLIIDCDMRLGRLKNIFNMPIIKGLSNLLMDDINNYNDYICETDIPNLDILSSGKVPPNPSELLNSDKFKSLLNILKEKYHLIILDTPPALLITDSLIISKYDCKCIIVSKYNSTSLSHLKDTIKLLDNGSNIAGVIINSESEKNISKYYNKYYE